MAVIIATALLAFAAPIAYADPAPAGLKPLRFR
jgi:hypothetical protein